MFIGNSNQPQITSGIFMLDDFLLIRGDKLFHFEQPVHDHGKTFIIWRPYSDKTKQPNNG